MLPRCVLVRIVEFTRDIIADQLIVLHFFMEGPRLVVLFDELVEVVIVTLGRITDITDNVFNPRQRCRNVSANLG